jgi:hypothetical protein
VRRFDQKVKFLRIEIAFDGALPRFVRNLKQVGQYEDLRAAPNLFIIPLPKTAQAQQPYIVVLDALPQLCDGGGIGVICLPFLGRSLSVS